MYKVIRNSALFEMLHAPTAQTRHFHEVVAGLQVQGVYPDDRLVGQYVSDLLHPPDLPLEWYLRNRALAQMGLIATVTENEAWVVESSQELETLEFASWDELARRVVEKRVRGGTVVLDSDYGRELLAVRPD